MKTSWFAQALRREIELRGLRQVALAKLLGKSRMTIYRWLEEENYPLYQDLVHVANVFGWELVITRPPDERAPEVAPAAKKGPSPDGNAELSSHSILVDIWLNMPTIYYEFLRTARLSLPAGEYHILRAHNANERFSPKQVLDEIRDLADLGCMQRVIVRHGDSYIDDKSDVREYRWTRKPQEFSNVLTSSLGEYLYIKAQPDQSVVRGQDIEDVQRLYNIGKSPLNPMYCGIVIRSKSLSQAYAESFDALWKTLPVPDLVEGSRELDWNFVEVPREHVVVPGKVWLEQGENVCRSLIDRLNCNPDLSACSVLSDSGLSEVEAVKGALKCQVFSTASQKAHIIGVHEETVAYLIADPLVGPWVVYVNDSEHSDEVYESVFKKHRSRDMGCYRETHSGEPIRESITFVERDGRRRIEGDGWTAYDHDILMAPEQSSITGVWEMGGRVAGRFYLQESGRSWIGYQTSLEGREGVSKRPFILAHPDEDMDSLVATATRLFLL